MYFHVFAFRWREGATERLQQHATDAILAFQGNIEGLIDVHVGQNDSPRGQGYAFVGVMRFTDRTAMEAYNVHPSHLELLEWLVPIIDPVELDFCPLDQAGSTSKASRID